MHQSVWIYNSQIGKTNFASKRFNSYSCRQGKLCTLYENFKNKNANIYFFYLSVYIWLTHHSLSKIPIEVDPIVDLLNLNMQTLCSAITDICSSFLGCSWISLITCNAILVLKCVRKVLPSLERKWTIFHSFT